MLEGRLDKIQSHITSLVRGDNSIEEMDMYPLAI